MYPDVLMVNQNYFFFVNTSDADELSSRVSVQTLYKCHGILNVEWGDGNFCKKNKEYLTFECIVHK